MHERTYEDYVGLVVRKALGRGDHDPKSAFPKGGDCDPRSRREQLPVVAKRSRRLARPCLRPKWPDACSPIPDLARLPDVTREHGARSLRSPKGAQHEGFRLSEGYNGLGPKDLLWVIRRGCSIEKLVGSMGFKQGKCTFFQERDVKPTSETHVGTNGSQRKSFRASWDFDMSHENPA